MTCYHPLNAYQDGDKIKFGANPEYKPKLLLPCGQCIGCKLARSSMWAIRAMHESSLSDQNCFITLTYNEENLPYDNSLTPIHFQKFIRKLRKRGNEVRYLMCGEYGEHPITGKIHRPHYHALLFGYDPPDREHFDEDEGIITYSSSYIDTLWGRGFTTVGDLTLESAAYVARYSLKKITASQTSEDKYHAHYETYTPDGEIRQAEPEYATMSGKPGIGKTWYDQYHSDIFPHDTTIYKGKNIKTPRYYENLLRSSDLSTFNQVKAKRKAQALLHAKDNTPDRLRVREICTKRKLNDNFLRKLHHET